MTRREHEIRRQIPVKLQERIAADPVFRVYELGMEAGQLLLCADEEAMARPRQNFSEARALIAACRSRKPRPEHLCDYTSSF